MSHVLVIEDDEGVRNVVALLLEGSHTITCVEDCAGAEEAIVKVAPDVVILDVALPHNPSAAARSSLALAASLTVSDIPVIFMTGYSDLAESLERIRMPVLRKPFHLIELRREIEVAMARTKHNRQPVAAGLRDLLRRPHELATMVARLGGSVAALKADLTGISKDECQNLRERAIRARRLALLTERDGAGPFYAIAIQIENTALRLEALRLVTTARERAHYTQRLLTEVDALFEQAQASIAATMVERRAPRKPRTLDARDLREEALVLREEARAVKDLAEKRAFASRAVKFAQLAQEISAPGM
jgi:DNA-binding response OmpR family regulator